MDPENISKNNQIKAVLFDMDGVLVNSMKYHLEAWKTVLNSFDINVSERFKPHPKPYLTALTKLQGSIQELAGYRKRPCRDSSCQFCRDNLLCHFLNPSRFPKKNCPELNRSFQTSDR